MEYLMRSGKSNALKLNKLGFGQLAFSLVELLVVLAILALLLTIAAPRYFSSIEHAKESALIEDLNTLRQSIDKFYGDTGQYPESLSKLVEQKYIRKIPIDPITEKSTTWILIEAEPPLIGVFDVHSGAETLAKNGTKYSEW